MTHAAGCRVFGLHRSPRPAGLAIAGALVAGLAALSSAAQATTYRCEADGRVTYSDKPCATGNGVVVATDDPVDPAARAAADARRQRDQSALDRAEQRRARERQEDERAAALARRRGSDVAKHSQACAKLARRVRDAHDAFDVAGPRDQPKARLRMQHADQDFAALCKR